MVVEKAREAELLELLQREGVGGFSVIPSVFGRGESGAHFGTRVFPGENSMIIALVFRQALDALGPILRTFAAGLRTEEAFKATALDAVEIA